MCPTHVARPTQMNLLEICLPWVPVVAMVLAFAILNARTDEKPSRSWPWPETLDAVAAAPESHKVLLENDRVRVLEVVIEPGTKEPPHTHRWPSVMMVDRRSRIRYYDEMGKLVFETPVDADLQGDLDPQWMDPEGLHAVENIGSAQYHAIRVELKTPLPSSGR